ncbi:MAG: cupin domain-containing protein [Oligoflexia bacterium]|nr:cupin domain-containing protein [Oligoflexia bacterium]MBF0364811.1 cupin domain-containing protein [Oligoflexia bacterium]
MKIKINHPSEERLQELDIKTWDKWECAPSTFEWEYSQEEVAYVFNGRAKIKSEFEEVEIKSGDLVVFPKGLKCTWIIIESIKKVYRFN